MTRANYHHGNLREALVDAAQGLIQQTGVASLSLRGVAREAGVSQAAPYHHFSNKEALLAAVAQRGFKELIERGTRAQAGITDPQQRLRKLGYAYLAFGLERPELYSLMFGGECPSDRHPDLEAFGSAAFEMVLTTIIAGQQSGVFRPSDVIGTGVSVWSTVHGLVALLQHKLENGKEMAGRVLDRDAMIESVLDFVEQGLMAHP